MNRLQIFWNYPKNIVHLPWDGACSFKNVLAMAGNSLAHLSTLKKFKIQQI